MPNACEKTAQDAVAPVHLASKTMWAQLAVLGLAFLIALGGPLALLVDTWSYMDFSHGALVPVVSLYIVWVERERLKALELSPSYLGGIAVLAAGAVILMLGRTAGVVLVEETSLLVIIPGLVLLLLGFRFIRALALPLAYLLLMVPVLNPLIDRVHWPFQLITARFAAAVLPYCSVPVYRNVQFLELPNVSLEVAEACSGANFMVSVIAIAIPLAYFTQREWWRKAVLMVVAFFIGLFTNGLRVTLIGVWSYYELGDALHGPYHLLQGYFVSIFGFIFLFAAAHLLKRLRPGRVEEGPSGAAAAPPARLARTGRKGFTSAWATAVVILAAIGVAYSFYSPSPVPLGRSLAEFPMAAGPWKGSPSDYYGTDALRVPDATDELNAVYRSASGRAVGLYIGYLDSQTQDRELIGTHFSKLYMDMSEFIVPGPGAGMTVNRTVLKKGPRESVVLFWYNLNGRPVANRYSAKLATAVDGLVHRQTNGAFVMVTAEFDGDEDMQRALNDEAALINELRPALSGFFKQR
ncbi:MAG: exosortase W [Thermodesulfobacteriota bacterium]